METIEQGAFIGCSLITTLSIPASVTYIGADIVGNNSNLTTINVDAQNSHYSSVNGVLYDKNQQTLIRYPAGKPETFFAIPQGVSSTSFYALGYCQNLDSISIPNSVTHLGICTFAYNENLTSITVSNPTPIIINMDDNVFANVNLTNITLYVPAGTKSLYKAADVWKDFGKIEEAAPETIPVTSVSLNRKSADLDISKTLQLTATVNPSNATNKNVSWRSSDATIATVNSVGLVTTLAAGSADIIVTTEDGAFADTCRITVNAPVEIIAVTGVSINLKNKTVDSGEEFELTATVNPGNATNKNVSWRSNNTSVATVNSVGLVTTLAAGSANVIVTTEDGAFADTCRVTVNALVEIIAVTGVSISLKNKTVDSGEEFELTATVNPSDASNKKVSWSSSDATIATVNGVGLVTALAAGSANIIVTTEDGAFADTCRVTVNVPVEIIAVTGVSVSPTEKTLAIGETTQLTATVSPSNAANKNISWNSSNTKIATVNSAGLETAVAAGSTTITVTTEDGGFTATCQVTVEEDTPSEPDINVDENEPAGENGQGSIDVSLNIPTDVPFEGTFTITLPAGFSLNLDLTSLAAGLSSSYTLTITPLGNNQWQLSIAPKSGLRSDDNSSYQKIVNLVYDIEEDISDGTYQVFISDLNFEFEDGSSVSKEAIEVDVTVDHSYVGIQTVDYMANVYYHNGNLVVDTSAEELVSVYSISGNLLYQFPKQIGKTTFALGGIRSQILIVRGSPVGIKKW